MDIIPLILTESAAKALPIEYLARLAECSTDIVKQKVRDYLSNPDADKEVVTIVKTAYAEQLLMEEFLNSPELKETVDVVQLLDYYTITPYLTIKQLHDYKNAIISVLGSDFAVPYIAPINGALIKELRTAIMDYGREINNSDVKYLAERLQKYSRFFRDSQYAPHKGTVVKKIIRNRSKYEIILKGIDFMIEKKKSHSLPMSWRYL